MQSAAALVLCTLVSACSALAPSGAARSVVRGPLPTRIQHPLALLSPHLSLRRAVAQPAGEVGIAAQASYASLFERVARDQYEVLFDGELARASALVRVGLGGGWDLETEVAALYGSGGFLDHFLAQYHAALGLPNQGRGSVAEDQYGMHVEYRGEVVYSLDSDEVLLQDVPLVFTLADETPNEGEWSLAWRAGVELPLGSEERGAGNGALDWILGACAERSVDRWTHFVSGSVALTHAPTGFDGTPLELQDLVELAYACELRVHDAASLVVQLDALSPLVRGVSYEELAAPIVELGFGLVAEVGERSRVNLSFHDDLVSAAGPDFALCFGWQWNL